MSIKKPKLLIIVILSFLCQYSQAQRWTISDVGIGAKPAIDVDENDEPHIAYMLEATPGFVKHAEIVDDAFVSTTVQEAYYYGPLDISTGPGLQLGISVHHHDIQDEITFFRDILGVWTAEPVPSDGHDGWDNSIAFDSNGFPHTSSVDPSNFGSSNGVEYAWKDAGGWNKEVIGSVPVRYMFSTSIALDGNDAPHIVYYASDTTYYATKASGSWQIEKVGTENGKFPTLLLDSENDPHLAYYVQNTGDRGVIRYAKKKEGVWEMQDIDQLFNVPISFEGARRVTALQMDDEEKIHACYGDRDVVKYAILDDNEWSIDTVMDVTNDVEFLGAQVDLALNSKGFPYITYFEVTNLSPLTGVVKHATALDKDDDGFSTLDDCNDNDPEVNPDATEIADNGKDDDCDGEQLTTTSIHEIDGAIISVYPNPVANQLNLELPDLGSYAIDVITLSGKNINHLVSSQNKVTIDLSNHSTGVYLLRVTSLSSNSMIMERIVLQK